MFTIPNFLLDLPNPILCLSRILILYENCDYYFTEVDIFLHVLIKILDLC